MAGVDIYKRTVSTFIVLVLIAACYNLNKISHFNRKVGNIVQFKTSRSIYQDFLCVCESFTKYFCPTSASNLTT